MLFSRNRFSRNWRASAVALCEPRVSQLVSAARGRRRRAAATARSEGRVLGASPAPQPGDSPPHPGPARRTRLAQTLAYRENGVSSRRPPPSRGKAARTGSRNCPECGEPASAAPQQTARLEAGVCAVQGRRQVACGRRPGLSPEAAPSPAAGFQSLPLHSSCILVYCVLLLCGQL